MAKTDLITTHRLLTQDARDMAGLPDESVHLVVTSPPYPMIQMWDDCFGAMNPRVTGLVERAEGPAAFELMHLDLDRVWRECWRVLVPGGLACINIGDATRSLGGDFAMYPNHARILAGMGAAGFGTLPDIIWRKPNNSPNKFMGSGMLPAGAYVTYEHEYILILRKGGKRAFPSPADKAMRWRSAYFWEERNTWFSDVWMDLRGVGQGLAADVRARSGAFPLELPFRLITMFSLYGDVVLDPFVGTGTTMLAAASLGRSSVGLEREEGLEPVVAATMTQVVSLGTAQVQRRLKDHAAFVEARLAGGKLPAHHNSNHDLPVITRQEAELRLLYPTGCTSPSPREWRVVHGLEPGIRAAAPIPAGEQVGLF